MLPTPWLTMPMRRHVDYTPEFGAHTQDSALCATCHTLFTPTLASDGKLIGELYATAEKRPERVQAARVKF